MTLIELVEEVSKQTLLPKTVVAKVLRTFLSSSKKVLKEGESIKLPGFGVFYVLKPKPRKLFGSKSMSEVSSTVRFRESRGSRYGKARSGD